MGLMAESMVAVLEPANWVLVKWTVAEEKSVGGTQALEVLGLLEVAAAVMA